MADAGIVAIVETELEQARDISETRSLAELREATGAGHDDLMEALAELQGGGRISEVAPGEYMRADVVAVEPPPRRNGRPEEEPAPDYSLAEAERAHAGGRAPRSRTENVRVQLDADVAAVMDPDGLGKLVEAGIAKANERGVGFIFEVTP